MKKSFVVADLPRAGLGNKLFIWGRALIFSKINGLQLYTVGWSSLHIGPWIRNEKSKRFYFFSVNRKYILLEFKIYFLRWLFKYNKIVEPDIKKIVDPLRTTHFVFNQIPHWNDFFKDLKDRRIIIINEFDGLLKKSALKNLNKYPNPIIGVHVRLGDFRKLTPNEDFSKVGAVRTPFPYFIYCINTIRALAGSKVPVSIFSDGKESELNELLALENINLIYTGTDIFDLFLLSKSKIIVTSAGSTFGYWAGFLSNSPVIIHPDHIHESLRSNKEGLFEGSIYNINEEIVKKAIN